MGYISLYWDRYCFICFDYYGTVVGMDKEDVMSKVVGSLLSILFLIGCSTDARVASHNLSRAADQFEINRRVVFYNGITSEYILSLEGRCSIEADKRDNQLEVTCKTGPGAYKKHFLGLSDNVTYFAEQLANADVSVYHYKVIFKPQVILPDVDAKGSAVDLTRPR